MRFPLHRGATRIPVAIALGLVGLGFRPVRPSLRKSKVAKQRRWNTRDGGSTWSTAPAVTVTMRWAG